MCSLSAPWQVYSVFNGALLRTLKTLWLSSDLFLMDLLIDGRSRLVHRSKGTNDL